MQRVAFKDLRKSDLFVDCIYEGGEEKNLKDEVLSKLVGCGISGGFRKLLRKDGKGFAYVVLYTSREELEWPDYLDVATGIFRYYGDNRKPGQSLTQTKPGGNLFLEGVFSQLNSGSYSDIPPILIFQKEGHRRDMRFLGLAAPGNPSISRDHELMAFWRNINQNRFQNYEAYFTVLDTGSEPITRKWLWYLINDHEHALDYAPAAWKEFVKRGREGIRPLIAPSMKTIPDKLDQIQMDSEGLRSLSRIRELCKKDNYVSFEACATNIVSMMDSNLVNFVLTRPWRDGGRDAIGDYLISQKNNSSNPPLRLDCSLEAKCYDWTKQGVGVHEMSRLISRLRYRQFGIMVTTSYVAQQAYEEVVEDRQPILIVTATDIASTLRRNQITPGDIDSWFADVMGRSRRL